MKVVITNSNLRVPVERGRRAIDLGQGVPYIMHDVEAGSGRQAGALAAVRSLPPRPVAFNSNRRFKGRLVVPFIGGLGDALSMFPLLRTLVSRSPGVSIHVVTTPGPAEVFALSSHVDEVRAYPLTLAQWRQYDGYLSMERVLETNQSPGRALPLVFADAVGMELDEDGIELEADSISGVPPVELDLPGGPLIALTAGEGRSWRLYPLPMLERLARELASRNAIAVLLGHADPARAIEATGSGILDLRGRTPSIASLAACLRRVDAVAAHDSFLLHLAGALGVPGIGLFGPTSATHAAPYASLQTRSSGISCAPCHEVSDRCPKGLPRCVAWDDDALDPVLIAQELLELAGAGVGDRSTR